MIIENELTDLRDAFSIVVNECSIGIIISDNSGIIKSVNKKLCELSGYTVNELSGADIDILTHHRSTENSLRHLISDIAPNENFEGEIYLRLHSGKSINQKVRMLALKNFPESNQYLIFYLEPVPVSVETVDLKNNSESLISLGKMAAVLSHEIKTPLTSIKMNVDMISRDPNLPVNRLRSMQIIKNEISRLERLSKDVLYFSRSTGSNQTTFIFHDLVGEISTLLSPQLADRNISINNNIEKNVKIQGDRQNLKAMLMHLVENSIESIKKNGKIKLWNEIIEKDSSISFFLKDTGEGIKNPENIFDLFFTSKSTGTGLGLSIAKKIIEDHCGKIELLSGEKGNTIFKISLPGVLC